ncbi:MAG: hypothetical protein EP349_06710 [Alphaproteobacteria bacterium]|nr:MAG: hypothetical protein EP349_06710 [Alphaproteobacteria bacterium]
MASPDPAHAKAEERFQKLSAAMLEFATWVHHGEGQDILSTSMKDRDLLGTSVMAGSLLVTSDTTRKKLWEDTIFLFQKLVGAVLPHLDDPAAQIPSSCLTAELAPLYERIDVTAMAELCPKETPSAKPRQKRHKGRSI